MRGLLAEVVRRPCSSSPKSQLRGQGIHTAISLRDLRDASQDHHLNCAIQITLRDANLLTHRPKYHH